MSVVTPVVPSAAAAPEERPHAWRRIATWVVGVFVLVSLVRVLTVVVVSAGLVSLRAQAKPPQPAPATRLRPRVPSRRCRPSSARTP